jgi:uncharacterized membrane protein YphA (DoxX/SURF4 family)
MTAISPHRTTTAAPRRGDPAHQAFLLLRTALTVAPIIAGVDKFTQLLTNWDTYLAPWINDLVPGTAHQAMMAVGVVEVVAGLLVAVRPRIGGLVVALWLAGIIVDLLSMGAYLDVALRDLGLLVAALALSLLAADPRVRAGAGAVAARTRA